MIRGRDDPTDAPQGLRGEGNGGNDVLKMVLNIACKAGKRVVGESCSMVRMADQTLVQTQLKTLHSIIQMRDCLACHVFSRSCVACINNLAVYETTVGVPSAEAGVTNIKRRAVLIVTSMYNGSLQREGRVGSAHRW